MSLLTYARYVALTGDTSTAVTAVEAAIVDAEKAVTDFLRRPLALDWYSHELQVHQFGRVHVKAVPLVSIPASATYVMEDTRTIRGVVRDSMAGPIGFAEVQEWLDEDYGYSTGYPELFGKATVLYFGGWTAESVPYNVERAIAWCALSCANPGASPVPAGATSVHVGDVSVSFGAGGNAEPIDDLWPAASTVLTPYRYKDASP